MRMHRFRFGRGFKVGMSNARAQAAQMTLAPGKSEGDARNRHHGSDQWLFVVAGSGVAIVNERRVKLTPGTMLLIEHGDRHQILNDGRQLLKTLNFYAPPAYRSDGNPLPPGKP